MLRSVVTVLLRMRATIGLSSSGTRESAARVRSANETRRKEETKRTRSSASLGHEARPTLKGQTEAVGGKLSRGARCAVRRNRKRAAHRAPRVRAHLRNWGTILRAADLRIESVHTVVLLPSCLAGACAGRPPCGPQREASTTDMQVKLGARAPCAEDPQVCVRMKLHGAEGGSPHVGRARPDRGLQSRQRPDIASGGTDLEGRGLPLRAFPVHRYCSLTVSLPEQQHLSSLEQKRRRNHLWKEARAKRRGFVRIGW